MKAEVSFTECVWVENLWETQASLLEKEREKKKKKRERERNRQTEMKGSQCRSLLKKEDCTSQFMKGKSDAEYKGK